METSQNFRDAKEMYFNRHLPVTEMEIIFSNEGGRAKLVFDDSGTLKELTGSEADFVEFTSRFKVTVRDGEKKIIDVTKVPAKTIAQFYKNSEYFIPAGKDEPKVASRRIAQRKSRINCLWILKISSLWLCEETLMTHPFLTLWKIILNCLAFAFIN